MKKIYAIHGAFSTPKIFSYLNSNFQNYEWEFLNYSKEVSNIENIVRTVIEDKSSTNDKYHLIGHSMGGLIALSLANQPWVESVATIATPLGGLDLNLIQSYLSRSKFLSEISSSGKFIKSIHSQNYNVPVLHLISTMGFNPYMYETNDGVITLRTQKAWSTGKSIEIHSNHSEIMLDKQTVNILDDWLG